MMFQPMTIIPCKLRSQSSTNKDSKDVKMFSRKLITCCNKDKGCCKVMPKWKMEKHQTKCQQSCVDRNYENTKNLQRVYSKSRRTSHAVNSMHQCNDEGSVRMVEQEQPLPCADSETSSRPVSDVLLLPMRTTDHESEENTHYRKNYVITCMECGIKIIRSAKITHDKWSCQQKSFLILKPNIADRSQKPLN